MRRVAVGMIVFALMAAGLTGCQEVKIGARCSGNGAASSGAWVAVCKKGRWTKWITKAAGTQLLNDYLAAHPPAPPTTTPPPPPVTAPPTTTPPPPVSQFGNGVFDVGTGSGQLRPGLYTTDATQAAVPGGSNCEVERFDGNGNSLGYVPSFGLRGFVLIRPTDSQVAADGWCLWTPATATALAESSNGDGTFRVGAEIQTGAFVAQGSSCVWRVVNGLDGSDDAVDRTGGGAGSQLVALHAGDAALETHGCGPWIAATGPATSFTNVFTTVGSGTGQVPSGVYTTSGTECGWLRLDGNGNTLGVDVADGRLFMQVRAGDAEVVTIGDCAWVPATSSAATFPSSGDGVYRVGIDIAPGSARALGGPNCEWTRLSSLDGSAVAVLEDHTAAVRPVITVAPTDVAIESQGCGRWSAPPPVTSTPGQMWVADKQSNSLIRINPATLAVAQTIALTGVNQIGRIIKIGQKIWYSDDGYLTIGMYDLQTQANHPGLINTNSMATFAWSANRPTVLFAGLRGTTPPQLRAIDISTATPTLLTDPQLPVTANFAVVALDVSPDGSKLWAETGSGTYELSVATGTYTGRLFTGLPNYAESQATATVGGHQLLFTSGLDNGTFGVVDIAVYDTTIGTTPIETYSVGVAGGDVLLSVSPDGSKIYALDDMFAYNSGPNAELTTIDRTNGTRASLLANPSFGGDIGPIFTEPTTGRVFIGGNQRVDVYDPDGWYVGAVTGLGAPISFAV